MLELIASTFGLVCSEDHPPARTSQLREALSNREKLGMDQVFVAWTSKSGLNQPAVV